MGLVERRKQVLDQMEEHSILVLYSGIEQHVSADEYAPFQANRNFFYLTGLRRDNMALLIDKALEEPKITLYIEEPKPDAERWYGRKVTKEEAQAAAALEKPGQVHYIDSLEDTLNRIMTREDVETVYFDTYRHQAQEIGRAHV